MDDTENIFRKSWCRNIEPVNKIGYMDGAADGQAAAYQSSFDMGYKQGFGIGIQMGSKNAMISMQQKKSTNDENEIRDPRQINCQLCINGVPSEQNVVNLYNTQQEINTKILKQMS